MLIHCTKKLAAKLPNVSSTGLIETNSLGSWHANLYLIDRRNCVMFCHDQTRFMLFAVGLKKADFANLDYWFQDLFANTMLRLGYEHELIEATMDLMDELQFDTTCDRSVQGTMRVSKQDIDALLWDFSNVVDLPMYTASARLCHRPVTIKGMKGSECLWPDDAMKTFLYEKMGVVRDRDAIELHEGQDKQINRLRADIQQGIDSGKSTPLNIVAFKRDRRKDS